MSYKRIVITEFGGPEVLKSVEEEQLPEPAEGEVRARVLVTTASFTDIMIRKGMYREVKEKPPFSPGYDMVGVVDRVGKGVEDFNEGDLIAYMTVIGGYSEYICLPAERLVRVPEGVDPAEAVSAVLSYVTAYQMLQRIAGVERGQSVMVHGAAGAVGTAILQLGNLLQLRMFGTASAGKHDLVSGLGGVPIDYRSEDFVERVKELTEDGVDAAFDHIGGSHFRRSFSCLRKGGILVAYGFYDAVTGKGGSIPVDFMKLKLWNLLPNSRSAEFYSIGALRKKHPDWFMNDLSHIFGLLRERKIKPVIDRRMPLSRAAEAHRLIEEGKVRGKIVLDVAD